MDEARGLAASLAQHLARIYPKELTVEGQMAKRWGRVYIDTSRNGFGQKDPWADFFRHRRSIRAAIEAVRSL